MGTLKFKRGDTLLINGNRTDPSTGAPVLFTADDEVRGEMVRNAQRVAWIATFDVGASTYRLSLSSAVARGLTIGPWKSDVQITNALSEVQSWETFIILIEEDITGAAD